jgi:pimeloyl-ACP methyl ester carboxylesterase
MSPEMFDPNRSEPDPHVRIVTTRNPHPIRPIMMLPNALSAARQRMDTPSGPINYYSSIPSQEHAKTPLLLIHSINAAGSSYEIAPIFEHYRNQRAEYSPDLPGFGFSDRSDRVYSVRFMVDAIHALVAKIQQQHGGVPIDAVALSLSSEFLARAAAERPAQYRSLAFISPTGMDKKAPYLAPPGKTRAMPLLHTTLRFPVWDKAVFNLLTTRRSIRYFLERTWGSKLIDEGLLEYDYLTTHRPGARFAPYYFVSGYLFSLDITRIYESLALPVWVSHGVRGDFQDYTHVKHISRANWRVTQFDTGALPHFEVPIEFIHAYDTFLQGLPSREHADEGHG